MDVEGFEGNVLGGGENLFFNSNVSVVFTEFVESMIIGKGGNPVQMMRRYAEGGYRVLKEGEKAGYMTAEEMIETATKEEFADSYHDLILHSEAYRSALGVQTSNESVIDNPGSANKQKVLQRSNGNSTFSIMLYEDNDIVSDNIIQHGTWEANLVTQLSDVYKKYSKDHNIPLSNLTFVDIGANIGWFSLNMAALGVNVIAFEPMQQNIDLINGSLHCL